MYISGEVEIAKEQLMILVSRINGIKVVPLDEEDKEMATKSPNKKFIPKECQKETAAKETQAKSGERSEPEPSTSKQSSAEEKDVEEDEGPRSDSGFASSVGEATSWKTRGPRVELDPEHCGFSEPVGEKTGPPRYEVTPEDFYTGGPKGQTTPKRVLPKKGSWGSDGEREYFTKQFGKKKE